MQMASEIYEKCNMFKPTGDPQIDHLNSIALALAKNREAGFGVLATGEQCYVALASNRLDLLEKIGFTIPEAMARLGEAWLQSLMASWQHAGNPAKYEATSAPVTACLDVAVHASNMTDAMDRIRRLQPDKVVIIGSNPSVEKWALDSGYQVEVRPAGSAIPAGAKVVPFYPGTVQSTTFLAAMETWASRPKDEPQP